MHRSVLICVGLFIAFVSAAKASNIPDEYGKLIRGQGVVHALDGNPFGDTVDLYTGKLEVVQVDVELPGNSPLPVRIGRRFRMLGSDAIQGGHFGDWDLDIPRVHGVFSAITGWAADRCTYFSSPDTVSNGINGPDGFGSFAAEEYWHGTFLYIPGVGDGIMLKSTPMSVVPADGRAYPIVTKGRASVRCLPSLAATSQAGSQGEGFEVITPDGVVYTLNHMVRRNYSEIRKSSSVSMRSASAGGPRVQPMSSEQYQMSRHEYNLFPTKVTDRFGNWVSYTWSSSNPWQLLGISSSDGRSITISYSGSSGQRIKSVSDGVRGWVYDYYKDFGGADSYLKAIQLPDGGRWAFSMSGLHESTSGSDSTNCDDAGLFSGAVFNGGMTHPSGVSVQFESQYFLMGRSWVPRVCIQMDLVEPLINTYALYPYRFYTVGISSRVLTGAGMPSGGYRWQYDYGSDNGCLEPGSWQQDPFSSGAVVCNSGSPVTRNVTVSGPGGSISNYAFGNRYMINEGKLLRLEERQGGEVLRSTINNYADAGQGVFPEYYGESVLHRGDDDFESMIVPVFERIVQERGRQFFWRVPSACGAASNKLCFDGYARPTKTIEGSQPNP